jgi:hypothetical protein
MFFCKFKRNKFLKVSKSYAENRMSTSRPIKEIKTCAFASTEKSHPSGGFSSSTKDLVKKE